MQVRRVHWINACVAAIILHAILLIGLKSRTMGEALSPPGPKIEIAAFLPGAIGAAVEEIEIDTPDKIEETGELDKTAVIKPAEPGAWSAR